MEERHHLVELLSPEHPQRLGQVGIGSVPSDFDQGGSTAPRLMRTLLRIEQAVDQKHEVPQHPRLRQIAKHLTEPESLSAIEVFGTGYEQVAMFPDEVRLLLLGRPLTLAVPLLVLAWPAPASLGAAFLGELASEPSQGVADVDIDVLDDVEDAKLVTGSRPEFCQESRVKVRTVGDDHVWQEPVVLEVVEEPPHVVLIIGLDQGEGDGEIAQRVGGQ
jgi:hypothetical protein